MPLKALVPFVMPSKTPAALVTASKILTTQDMPSLTLFSLVMASTTSVAVDMYPKAYV